MKSLCEKVMMSPGKFAPFSKTKIREALFLTISWMRG